jgi:hypothetical protein
LLAKFEVGPFAYLLAKLNNHISCCSIQQLQFRSVVAVAFQSVFRAEMHQNDVFSFFKKLFLRSAHQNDPKHKKN